MFILLNVSGHDHKDACDRKPMMQQKLSVENAITTGDKRHCFAQDIIGVIVTKRE